MGDFRIVIDGIGNHGQDREKKDGEKVDFEAGGSATPESIAKHCIDELKAAGVNVTEAKVIHWPVDNYGGPELNGRDPQKQIVDDLLSGERKGSF